MNPFANQLAALSKEHVTRNKWVFVPSHAIGNTLGERIALDGTNWLNLRFVTPLDIALRMGAPFLVERGIDPSEEGLGPALIMRLLLDLPTEAGYFRPLADQPTMAQALWTTIHELRMAGVKADDLKPDAFESAAKHAELRALLAAYERFLYDNNRGDMAIVYEEAAEHPDWCPIQPADCWTEVPDHVWSPLQRRLIEIVPGERIAPRALMLPGATLPRRLEGRHVVRVDAGRDATPLAFLMSTAEAAREHAAHEHVAHEHVAHEHVAPSTSHVARVDLSLFHAGGREAEIAEVFRRILASGAPLDHVEIACASDAHLLLVWEKALRRDWPVTLGPGIPAAMTRPGRALIGFCDWIEADFAAGHLRRLLQSGDMGIEEDDEGFRAGQAARTLARAEAGWGRATYDLSLGILQKSYSTRASDPDLSDDEREAAQKKAHLTDQIRTWIAKLIASVPPETDGKAPLQDVVNAAVAFLERSTSRVSALDHRSAAALVEYVKELRALGPFTCSLGEALRFIRERVESLHVAPDRPRPGHLYACRLQQAGYSGRPHLYVAGLEEARVFPNAAEDPVLLDAERVTISPDLKLSTDRIDEAVYATLERFASWNGLSRNPESGPDSRRRTSANLDITAGDFPSADGGSPAEASPKAGLRTTDYGPRTTATITFSYSCRDTREFRESFASWVMLQGFRLQQGNGALGYHDMKAALGEPVSSVPRERSEASTQSAWWLRSVVGTGDKGIEAVESTFTALARGRQAAESRESDAFTEYDGHVPAAGCVLDPCAPENSFSVTDLEVAAACPFRFFLKRGLGLRPLDEGEREKDIWLDPLTRGVELHDVYAALLRRCRAENRRADLRTDGPWLTKYAQDVLDRLNREMPAATLEILERETRDLLADVELFLEAESEPSRSEPIGIEVSFGRPLRDDGEELAREEPVEVDLGGGLIFRIAGRVDRIDKVGPSEFHIIDYKTGVFWRDDWKGIFNGGRRLQHALYGLAAVELLRTRYSKPRVTRAVYYFPTHKGRRERVLIPAPSRGRIAAVLSDLRELIVSGAFVHAADEKKACKFCDYTKACGVGVHEQAAAKAADSKLLTVGRLAAHE